MAFETPKTIKEVVERIHRKEYLLPAIQREFVWDTDQVEALFDSLMREYPVGSFLFWRVEKEQVGQFQFYEFLRDYHQRDNKHNEKASVSGNEAITAVLDGQQRLTSLYIGLHGSYTYKEARKRWDNDAAFPKRKLYLNLLGSPPEQDRDYDFRFLTETEAEKQSDTACWFPVADILSMDEHDKINDYVFDLDLPNERGRFASKTLFRLRKVIHDDRSINYFLEEGESLDKVLNIFIRVNSGGTELSHSDLLLSIATAQWQTRDAREVIIEFVESLKQIGNGFDFSKDFVLKSCLVLSDFSDIAFKVDNFNTENMLRIEENWDTISEAIRGAVVLAASFGFHRDTLTSANALIPIAYYLMKARPTNFAAAGNHREDREKIFKWLLMVILKRTFGGQPDNVLRPMRTEIRNHYQTGFPLKQIVEAQKGSTKPIDFTTDEIENLTTLQYGKPYTFSSLAILYPTLDFKNKFHQDHIFPVRLFTRAKLRKHGIPEPRFDYYFEQYNSLANLQLLEGIENQEKSGKPFEQWLEETYTDPQRKSEYLGKHYIPQGIKLSIDNFEEFITERKKLLVDEFTSLLDV